MAELNPLSTGRKGPMLLSRLQHEEAMLERLYATGRQDYIARSVEERIKKEIDKLKREDAKAKTRTTREIEYTAP